MIHGLTLTQFPCPRCCSNHTRVRISKFSPQDSGPGILRDKLTRCIRRVASKTNLVVIVSVEVNIASLLVHSRISSRWVSGLLLFFGGHTHVVSIKGIEFQYRLFSGSSATRRGLLKLVNDLVHRHSSVNKFPLLISADKSTELNDRLINVARNRMQERTYGFLRKPRRWIVSIENEFFQATVSSIAGLEKFYRPGRRYCSGSEKHDKLI